jgi:2-aminobenzoate-CoA ligase
MIEEFHRPEVVLEALREHRVETFTAIAHTWARMLDVVRDEPTVANGLALERAYAMWQSASSSQVNDGWRSHGIELLNNFGSTAFATWVLAPRPGDSVPRGSLGRAAPGYRVVAIESDASDITPLAAGQIGRMAVRGPTGLTYWRRPDLQQRDVVNGWTLVDDLIRFDDAGNAEYLGRTDFLVSTAGYKVAPVEVEQVLARHPAISEVAVIGTPDPTRQEIVTAFVALTDPNAAGDDLRRELQGLVRANLSAYKSPRRIEFVAALPRDAVGKVQPRVLQEWAARRPSHVPA